MSELLVIAGLSGAGRSEAAKNLEDLGWFVMDNLPPQLIAKVAELSDGSGLAGDRLALVIGTGRFHDQLATVIGELRDQVERLQVVFLDATTEVLIRRYESSRRRHPFDTEAGGSGSLATVIEAERSALEPVRMEADLVIDTSELSPPQLRSRLHDVFAGGGSETAMRTTVMSFGYKHGLPTDVDIVIDCRFLKNPHWVEDLRPLTGLDDPVRHFILEQPVAGPFVARLERLLALMLPQFVSEGKSYLTVAFGCTGGRHRSVAIAERFAEALDKLGHAPAVVHRDIDRG